MRGAAVGPPIGIAGPEGGICPRGGGVHTYVLAHWAI